MFKKHTYNVLNTYKIIKTNTRGIISDDKNTKTIQAKWTELVYRLFVHLLRLIAISKLNVSNENFC